MLSLKLFDIIRTTRIIRIVAYIRDPQFGCVGVRMHKTRSRADMFRFFVYINSCDNPIQQLPNLHLPK